MNKDLTYILGIIDCSGSMYPIAPDTSGAWNQYVKDQAAQPGECYIGLIEFNHQYRHVHNYMPADQVPEYVLSPGGNTALLDAIGRGVYELGQRLGVMLEDDKPAAVIVAIFTDGQENSSTEMTIDKVKAMVTEQREKYGWQVMFFGADEDAIQVAQSYGVSNSAQYARANSDVAFAAASSNTTDYRNLIAGGESIAVASYAMDFTEDQREAMINDDSPASEK